MAKVEQSGKMCSQQLGTTTSQFTLKEGDTILRDVKVTNVLGEEIITDMVEVFRDGVRDIVSPQAYAIGNY